MQPPKYSLAENERRFLVASLAAVPVDERRCVTIEDLYIENTRMRLRSVTATDREAVYKLCKKYPTDDAYTGAIVNVYLSAVEYALFNTMPGRKLKKRRYRVGLSSDDFGLDVFEGELDGLVLCEAEKPTREQIRALQFPPWATREVTEDHFFTGGSLAAIDGKQLQAKLRSLAR